MTSARARNGAARAAPPVAPRGVSVSVGTLNEGHLHASLKARYLQPGDRTEAAVDGYIVDILRGDAIIEIQTSSFAKIARKMRDLVSRYHVRLVHPVPRDRWIVKEPQQRGDAITRRKSPQHLGAIDVFRELVSFPELLAHPNFELDVVVTAEEAVWRYDGPARWRRRGWITVERRLIDVYETTTLRGGADCSALIPASLPAEFATAELAVAIARPRRVAQQMAYCLRKASVIEQVGSRGNAVVYGRVRQRPSTRRPRRGAAGA